MSDHDQSIDENSQSNGLKRQQLYSPFTSASPVSRKGKEPKRLFGNSSPLSRANEQSGSITESKADQFLEETAFENSSFFESDDQKRPSSVICDKQPEPIIESKADAFMDETALETSSFFERPQSRSSVGSGVDKDLSCVEEQDEEGNESADVTLSGNPENDINDAQPMEAHGTISNTSVLTAENESSSVTPNFPSESVSKSSLFSNVAPTGNTTPLAPPKILQEINKKAFSPITFSPAYPKKHQVDESLCEFLVLEKQSEHQEAIQNLQQQYEQKLAENEEGRKFEIDILSKQIETLTKKLKEANSREKELKAECGEVQTRLENAVEQTVKALEDQKSVEGELRQRAQQLEAEVVESSRIGKEMENKNESLEAAVNGLNEKIAQLELETKLHENAENLQEDFNKAKQENESLEVIVNELKGKLSQFETEQEQSSKRAEELDIELKNAQTQLEEFELFKTKIIEETAESSNLQAVLKEVQDRNETLEAENVQLNEKLSQFEAKINEIDVSKSEEVEQLMHQNKTLESAVSQFKEQLANFEANREVTSKQTEELENELKNAQRQLEEFDMLKNKINEETAESSNLQAVLKEVQDRNEILEAENVQLNEKLSQFEAKMNEIDVSKSEEVEQLMHQNKTLESAVSQFKEQLADFEGKREGTEELENELKNAQQQLGVLSVESSDLKDQLETLKQSLERSNQEKLFVEEELIASTENSEELRNELEIARKQNEELGNSLNIAQDQSVAASKFEELMSEKASLEDTLAILKEECSTAFKSAEDAEQSLTIQVNLVEASNVEKAKLSEELSNCRKTIEDLQQELQIETESRANAVKSEEEVRDLKAKYEEIQARLEKIVAEYALSAETHQSAQKELETRIAQIQIEAEECTQNKQSELEDVLRRNEKLEAEIVGLNEKISQFESKIDEQEEVEQLKFHNQSLQNSISELMGKVAQFESEQEQYLGQAEDLKDAQRQLEEFEMLQKKLDEMQEELKQIKQRNEELEDSATELKEKLSQSETQRESGSNRTDELENELTHSQKQLEELAAESKDLFEKLEHLQKENEKIEPLKNSVESCEREIAELKDSIENLKTENLELSQQSNHWKQEHDRQHAEARESSEKAVKAEMELTVLRKNSSGMDQLATTMAKMSEQMEQLRDDLAMANQEKIEAREAAHHDVTIMMEEVHEKDSIVEELRTRVAQLEAQLKETEEKLARAIKEQARLEKVCDDFDDDEAEYKNKIRDLEKEVKALKGVKTPPRKPGLLQQAYRNVQPISRESSLVSEEKEKDGGLFEDARDSFVETLPARAQVSGTSNTTPATPPAQNPATTMIIHPDDEESQVMTPNKSKANRSACQQQ